MNIETKIVRGPDKFAWIQAVFDRKGANEFAVFGLEEVTLPGRLGDEDLPYKTSSMAVVISGIDVGDDTDEIGFGPGWADESKVGSGNEWIFRGRCALHRDDGRRMHVTRFSVTGTYNTETRTGAIQFTREASKGPQARERQPA